MVKPSLRVWRCPHDLIPTCVNFPSLLPTRGRMHIDVAAAAFLTNVRVSRNECVAENLLEFHHVLRFAPPKAAFHFVYRISGTCEANVFCRAWRFRGVAGGRSTPSIRM